MNASAPTRPLLGRPEVLVYALPALLLAFAALPLYLLVPYRYVTELGLPLGLVGLVLTGSRLIDAVLDPFIGQQIDRTGEGRYRRWLIPACLVLTTAFLALLFPPAQLLSSTELLVWLGLTTALVSVSNSAAALAHQAWAVSWTPSLKDQARLVSGRELATLLGTILASGLIGAAVVWPLGVLMGLSALATLWAVGWLSRRGHDLAPQAHPAAAAGDLAGSAAPSPWGFLSLLNRHYSRLLSALTLNAIANAVPPTLFLFFVSDQLGLPQSWAAGLLAAYFLAAAASLGVWTRVLSRLGPRMTWLIAIGLAISAFLWALLLGPGDGLAFAAICLITGFALGAELICPALLLGQALDQAGDRGRREASLFGLWNLLAKLSLALASGLSLPLLDWGGYQPGMATATTDGIGLLSLAYAGIPSLLKLIAAGAVIWLLPAQSSAPSSSSTGAP